MRPTPNPRAEPFRIGADDKRSDYAVVSRHYGSTMADGNNGLFVFSNPLGGNYPELRCMISDGAECIELKLPRWEHVSVSTAVRCPRYEEMKWVKELFWNDDEVVMELHVGKSDHVNLHPYCLHLWKPLDATIPLPPKEMVA